MFASQRESVIPDMMILAKGLTGGYVPLAITLLTEKIFSPFVNGATASNILSYGHSYTGNALACAAAHASLKLFESERVMESLAPKIAQLTSSLEPIRSIKWVNDIRQCGFMAGIEVDDGSDDDRLGARICIAARKYGLLTRPIRNVIVLFPPFCITKAQLKQAVDAIGNAIIEVCGGAS
jgi:adenosylmethionine-8-amino-7-oxononanoate aminotransferase